MEQNYEIPISEYWRVMRKRRMTVLVVFGLVVLSTVFFTKLQTPVYVATIELKVERSIPLQQALSSAKPGDATLKGLDLGTELRLFKSLNMLSKVVEKVEVLPVEPERRAQALHSLAMSYQRRIRVEQIPDTTIITITVTAESPEKAVLVASAVADVYMVENTLGKRHQLEAVLKYVDAQIAQYSQEIEASEGRLLKFKQDEKVFAVTPEIKANLDRISVERTFEFEGEMLSIDADLKTLDGLIAQKKASGDSFMSADDLANNFIFTGLKRRLIQLEFERFLLLVDYTEKHPVVIEKDTVIASVKTRMIDMIKGAVAKPFDAEMEANLSFVLKKLFLESRREVLYRTINKYYNDEGALSSNQKDYVKLTREQERLMTAYNNLLSNREETRLSIAGTDDQSVSIVSQANASRDPISPNVKLNFLVSIVAGLLMGLMAAFIQESMDTTINTITDVETKLNLAVLGIIPLMKGDDTLIVSQDGVEKTVPRIDGLVTFYEPRSWLAQSFKILRTNLLQVMKNGDKKVIMFTSSEQQEGKSTVIANVAISMAQLGKKTVLLGMNLRRPTLYKRFGLKREPGSTDVLLGKVTWQEVLKGSTDILAGGLDVDKLLKMPGLDNLRIITAGHSIDNISELINSSAFDILIADLKKNFDIVLIDCPPILPVPDSMTMAGRVDGVVMVYKVGKTSRDVLKMAKSRLEHVKAPVLGIVLNQITGEEQVGASAYHFREYVETKNKSSFSPFNWFSRG